MFEPYVRATDGESESLSTSGTASFPIKSASASEFQANAIGVGIFRLVPLAERFTLYYGGRLAHIDEEWKSFTATASGVNKLLPPSRNLPSSAPSKDTRSSRRWDSTTTSSSACRLARRSAWITPRWMRPRSSARKVARLRRLPRARSRRTTLVRTLSCASSFDRLC